MKSLECDREVLLCFNWKIVKIVENNEFAEINAVQRSSVSSSKGVVVFWLEEVCSPSMPPSAPDPNSFADILARIFAFPVVAMDVD